MKMLESPSIAGSPVVTTPPNSFFEIIESPYQEVARNFYAKYISAKGLGIAAAGVVADEALYRAYDMVVNMLAGRPDVLAKMVENGMYLVIIGKDQVYTDIPEYSDMPNPAYWNERVRGTGGLPTSFGEENLLSLPIDRYDDESIAVHEFCHLIDFTLDSMDPTWTPRRSEAFQKAIAKGLWKNTYAGSCEEELWAEAVQSYFDCNRVNNWNHGPIGTREQLKIYDPEIYELIREAFNIKPEHDWRYRWLQPLPNVIAPPERFAIDPFYSKFTWARELPIIGRGASDEALLKANDTVRKMFAYRHDILKALIVDGVKIVVLGPNEKVADLPDYQALENSQRYDVLTRILPYNAEMKLLVVGQENVLGNPREARVDDQQLIRLLADCFYQLTCARPFDPEWENRTEDVQQYELRVTRLDEKFGAQVQALFASAMEKGLWRGSAAVNGGAAYFAQGVLAYFDAAGQDGAPQGAVHPINSRELLKVYDGELYALVEETMAYVGKVDWRYGM